MSKDYLVIFTQDSGARIEKHPGFIELHKNDENTLLNPKLPRGSSPSRWTKVGNLIEVSDEPFESCNLSATFLDERIQRLEEKNYNLEDELDKFRQKTVFNFIQRQFHTFISKPKIVDRSEEFKAELQNKDEVEFGLRQELKELENNNSELLSKIDSLGEFNSKIEEKANYLEDCVFELEQNVDDLILDNISLKNLTLTLGSELKDHESIFSSSSDEKEQKFNEFKTKIEDLNKTLSACRSETKDIASALNEEKNEKSSLALNYSQLERRSKKYKIIAIIASIISIGLLCHQLL